MIPVRQTVLTPPNGDCLAACIASVLEVPLQAVPNFIEHDDWHDRYAAWLAQFNLQWISFPAGGDWLPRGYAIAGVLSGAAGFSHAVVCVDGEVVWNPHPGYSADCDLGQPLDWTLFTVLDPSKPSLVHLLRDGVPA